MEENLEEKGFEQGRLELILQEGRGIAEDFVGFISVGILLYIFLNLLEKSEIDSPSFLFRDPNSMI